MNVLKLFHSNDNMRIIIFFLIFANLLFSQPPCPDCADLFNAYETGLVAELMDETVNVYMYAVYNGERLPVGNATLFMEVYNSTGDLYSRCRVFTDEKGKAVFSISEYKEICSGEGILRGCRIGIKFCCSSSPNCLLQPCLNESITSFEDVQPCGNIKPASWPDAAYINDDGTPVFAVLSPTYAEVVYIPTLLPPLFGGAAPAVCLPLFIIAGMLLVGAYATGGTPFFWFDLNALRFTTGQRARVSGKGGFILQQAKISGAAKSAGELLKKVPGVKKGVEVVEKGVGVAGRAVAATTGAVVGFVAKPLGGGGAERVTKILPDRIKEGLIKGKPAPILERMAKAEKKLRGVGTGVFRVGREVGEGRDTGVLWVGQERRAIRTGQFGGEEIFSALLMAGFAKLNVASLAAFFGVPQAIISSVKAGAAKEQLKYLAENSETLKSVLEGEAVPVKDAEAIYSNLSGLCTAIASEFPEGDQRREDYLNLGKAFSLCAAVAGDNELLNTPEGREFYKTITQQAGEAFLVVRTFNPTILEAAEKAREQLATVQPGTPEYDSLMTTITTAQLYFEAHSTLQTIANLSIAWAGNIQVGGKIISLGMNEGELREARETLADAYLNPGEYEAERDAVSLIGNILRKPEKELTKEDKELLKLTEKALKGDEKAMEELKDKLVERASQVSENISQAIELVSKDPKSLSEEERKEQNQNILSYMAMSYPKIEDSDKEILRLLLNVEKAEKEGKQPPTKEEINNLFEKYRPMVLEYYQDRQRMYTEQIPSIIENLNNRTLFAYLSL